MKKIIFDKEKNMIFISEGHASAFISLEELRQMQDIVNKEVYFKEDVIKYLEDKNNEGELTAEYLDNEQLITDMLNGYTEFRNKYDGDAEGLNWLECLDEAWSNINLDNYEMSR